MTDESNLQKDSWDSVSEQPSCLICSMTFPNKVKLDRHVKYSDMHAKMVEKLEKAEQGGEQEMIEEEKPKLVQVEGQHYKLLYSGTKKFWRTRDTIDLHIYIHMLCHVIEVIPFDVERHKELNRSYLEHFILLSTIEKDAQQRVEERKESLKAAKAKDKHNKEILPSEKIMMEEAKRQVLVTHILDRMQILAGPPKQLVYTPITIQDIPSLANDSGGVQKPALLAEPPTVRMFKLFLASVIH